MTLGASAGPCASPESEPVAGSALQAAADQIWDAVVIGAGPAGTLASRLLAQRGRRVLLLEARPFPRFKVCGGCLNARALSILELAGLGSLLETSGAVPLRTLQIRVPGNSLELPLPGGLSLSRAILDERLRLSALDSGVQCLTETTATVAAEAAGSVRTVIARHGTTTVSLLARTVVCADGLLRSSTKQIPELAARAAAQSHLGLGVCLADSWLNADMRNEIQPGTIYMVPGPQGYVGLCRTEESGLSIAAAVAPGLLKSSETPGRAVDRILTMAGLSGLAGADQFPWQGTPLLTSRSRRVAAERVFVLGDAAGYVEPFTGEGMSQALESAWRAVPWIDRAIDAWSPTLSQGWETLYQQTIRHRQWICRGLAQVLRRRWAVRLLFPVLKQVPALPRWLVARLNIPFTSNSRATGILQ